ncbi:hypothetical protein SAMN05421594_2726 [Chryseobacterium oleae]|uniref:Uncharacterized protein n=1 Tax=Chryseobacterium oleae TaxID=491207 RepID=A0A1I4YW48_CHROL|nr:hypothetical protein SAMN05421594_2726 [Chryseobacterium oleae]
MASINSKRVLFEKFSNQLHLLKSKARLTLRGYKIGVPDGIRVTLNVSNYDKDADLFNDNKEINRVLNWHKSFNS